MRKRAPRGSGTKRQVRPGGWKLTVTVGRWSDGTPRRLHRTVHARSENEAGRALADFVAETRDGRPPDSKSDRDITVDAAVERFLTEHLVGDKGREPSTIQHYRSVYSRWRKAVGPCWRRSRSTPRSSCTPRTRESAAVISPACSPYTASSSRTSTTGPESCAPSTWPREPAPSLSRGICARPPCRSSGRCRSPTCCAAPNHDGSCRPRGRLLADMNALHPFQEGNGRAQRAFLQLLARDAGYHLRWGDVEPAENMAASEAAMSDPDAFGPLLDRILVPAAVALPVEELLLSRDEPPTLEGP
jgi:hypothetical protein